LSIFVNEKVLHLAREPITLANAQNYCLDLSIATGCQLFFYLNREKLIRYKSYWCRLCVAR